MVRIAATRRMSPSALETSTTSRAAVWRCFGGIMLSALLVLVWIVLFTVAANLDTLCYGMLCYGAFCCRCPLAVAIPCFVSLCFATCFASYECVCWAFACHGFALLCFGLLCFLFCTSLLGCLFFLSLIGILPCFALIHFSLLFIAALCCAWLCFVSAVVSHCPPKRANGPTAQRPECCPAGTTERANGPTGQRANHPTTRTYLPSL